MQIYFYCLLLQHGRRAQTLLAINCFGTQVLYIYIIRDFSIRAIRFDLTFYYIHFEITGDPWNLIGSQQCDLFPNSTIFCSKSHLFQIAPVMF